MGPLKFRAALKTAIALAAGTLGIVTIFWHDWIEALTGWDPDHGNGAAEWLIVAALLVTAMTTGVIAHHDWRMAAAARE
jgi:hypothetical protein